MAVYKEEGMGDISKNFDRSEFKCPCCDQDTVDAELITMLQAIRDNFGPVVITSANRCEDYNAKVGGSKKSQHLKGRAADIVVRGHTPKEIGDFIEKNFPNCGLGVYSDFTHIDSRGSRARWTS